MTKHQDADLNSIADWPSLREQGITLIQSMNTIEPQWTDYNTSDPGITLLETLCFAISDLSYRLDFPIEDLLTSGPSHHQALQQQFYPAQQVLPNAPVTTDDYRRVLLDIPGVNNAWVHGHDKTGLYYVYVDLSADLTTDELPLRSSQIKDELNRQRNVSEAFAGIEFVEPCPIELTLNVVLTVTANPTEVLLELTTVLSQFFTQSVEKNSFAQLLNNGQSVSDILQGPIPVNGFVSEQELQRTVASFPSDLTGPEFTFAPDKLIDCLQNVAGIEEANLEPDRDEWSIIGEIPYFSQAFINIIQDGIDLGEHNVKGEKLTTCSVNSAIDIDYPKGQYRHPGEYSTLQNQLPDYYGVGRAGLLSDAQPQDTEQASQLRAYLILFDQTLCDYFAQLDQVANLLAMQTNPQANPPNNAVGQAYFSQPLPEDALGCFASDYDTDIGDLAAGLGDANVLQKNKLLDYLLALFAETYMPLEIYNKIKEVPDELVNKAVYLAAKQNYLNKIVPLRGRRGQIDGLKQIIALKLAIAADAVVIEDNGLARELPIPFNTIAFSISNIKAEDYFDIAVKLPERFVGPETSSDTLHKYTWQTLLALIPAHIYFTLEEKAA